MSYMVGDDLRVLILLHAGGVEVYPTIPDSLDAGDGTQGALPTELPSPHS